MRLPSSVRSAGLLALACAAVALVVIAPGALATGGGGGGELEQVEAKLAVCKRDLAQAREAVNTAEDFLTLARRSPLILIDVPLSGITPVPLKVATDFIILSYLRGDMTRGQMVAALQRLARRAAQTRRILQEAIEEAREGVEKTLKRCAALAEQRNRLRDPKPPAPPATPATKLTLTFQGSRATVDLKTNRQTPTAEQAAVRDLQSGGTYGGSVSVEGRLPEGYSRIIVVHPVNENVLLNSTAGGSFTGVTQPKGFGSSTSLSAYVCKAAPISESNCRAGVTIYIYWKP